MKILAIETSCDETAVDVLDISGPPTGGFNALKIKILSDIVASQVKIHAPWGGVVPNLAKREHQRNLPIILKKTLKESKLLKFPISNFQFSKLIPKIDLITVTSGPGLEPALWVGINFAQELAKKWKKPLLAANHLEGHIFSVFLQKNRNFQFSIPNFQFPALALIVSGGHTQLVLMNPPAGGRLKYKIIGQTLDDAAGEAFDKVARILKLGYPGGPAISTEAAKILNYKSEILNKLKISLPRPMLNSKDYNFSFSGLKTAALYLVKDLEKKIPGLYEREEIISAIAKEFQQAAIDVLIKKTMRAAKEYRVKTITLGGGVVANKELRRQMADAIRKLNFEKRFSKFVSLFLPEIRFTGDNASMIALAAYFHALGNKKIGDGSKITADSNLNLD